MSSTVQYSTVQYSTVQYSTVQYSTVQYSTVQYSTVQYSTVDWPPDPQERQVPAPECSRRDESLALLSVTLQYCTIDLDSMHQLHHRCYCMKLGIVNTKLLKFKNFINFKVYS